MRKRCRRLFLAVMILVICLTGCSKKRADRSPVSEPATPPILIQAIEPTVSEPPAARPAQAESTKIPETSTESGQSAMDVEAAIDETSTDEQLKVDIDLTQLNSNMLYAEVYHMGISPENYRGKRIKVTGEFAHFPKDMNKDGNLTPGEEIYVCIISDALACCATGIEFIPEKESSFWSNQPEDGSKITITGVCDVFLDEVGWSTVIQLDNATVEPVN